MTEHVQKGILIVLFAILLALIFESTNGIVNLVALLVGVWGLVYGFTSHESATEPEGRSTDSQADPTDDSPD